MSDQNDLKYVVLHNHPEGLEMSQLQRDLLFATGNVIRVQECALFSLQPEFLRGISRRPLAVVLWGMADRYGVAEDLKIEVFEAKTWGDAHNYCQGYRLHPDSVTGEEGKEYSYTCWRRNA